VLALTTAALALAAPASGAAVTNTFSLSAQTALSGPAGSPSADNPSQLGYRWVTHADTDPRGSQPDTISVLTVFMPSPVTSNARYFPFCTQAQIEGQGTFPAACRSAIVGYGNAVMYAGSPGSPLTNSVKEDLNFLLVNGASGRQILMVLSSAPTAPIVITNRVVPADVIEPGGSWAFAYQFRVPADLQSRLGLRLTFTDITATIPGTARAFSTEAALRAGSYLETTACPGSIASQGQADFTAASGTTTPVTATGATACEFGTFDDPNPPADAAAPPQQGKTADVAPATPCDSPDSPPVPAEKCAKLCPPSGCSVRIRLPGSSTFLELDANSKVPLGATLDTRNGAVRLTSAGGAGQLQTGIFYGGLFKVTQTTRDPTTELRLLRQPNTVCRTAARASTQTKTKGSLWSNVKGRFRTRGQFAAATAFGTKWLTADRCDGTLVKVSEGAVSVRDLRRHRTTVVRTGRSYLAAARRAG
jgi:hypothetical protein